jgi:aryl-alcohol dehydrogenase-like predicted oxidoreductase
MNLGTAWKDMMGGVDKEESFKLLDYFYEQGGNFIDVCSPSRNVWLIADCEWVPK